MWRVKEVNKTDIEGDSHLQREGFNQKQPGSSIYEEESFLRIIEEQEISAGSVRVYSLSNFLFLHRFVAENIFLIQCYSLVITN